MAGSINVDPDLARRLGLDIRDLVSVTNAANQMEHKVIPVTFVEPSADRKSMGRNDPMAWLPPTYRAYGVIDRDHKNRVRAGEAWFVEKYEQGAATFLIPVVKITPTAIMDLLPGQISALAKEVAHHNPSLAADFLKVAPQPGSAERKRFEEQERQLTETKAQLATALKDLHDRKAQAQELEAKLQAAEARAAQGPKVIQPMPAMPPATVSSSSSTNQSPTFTVPAMLGNATGLVRHVSNGTLQGAILNSPFYEAHYSADLESLFLKPAASGLPCVNGAVHVPGLVSVVKPPAEYEAEWDARLQALHVYLT